jgi:hypothetical protein
MGYYISLAGLLAFYLMAIPQLKHLRNKKITNGVFSVLIFALYVAVVIRVYISVGFNDWNFKNTLPVANVSPFMFTLVMLMHLLPQKIKKHFYLLISLLSVGMILSSVFSCLYNGVINYKFHWHFLCDYLAHVLLSLYGVYLIKSGQVELNKKNALVSGAIIVGVAIFMLVLNVIFDTAFFGLSLNGKHSIYNVVLVESSYLSAFLYFLGLCGVLAMGYIYSRLIARKNKKAVYKSIN